MQRTLQNPRRWIGLFAFCLLALAAAALLPAPPVSAACPKIVETDYFFDAAKTQYAGTCTRTCNGQLNCSGTITIYKTTFSEPCGC